MTERLPAICAEDVLDAILEFCEDIEKDHAWHGACLALAELARRGLLLPHRLEDVMPRMIQAIHVSFVGTLDIPVLKSKLTNLSLIGAV